MTFSTIVVGTDGSAYARRAVEIAGEMARTLGAGQVHVVVGYRPMDPVEMQSLLRDLPEEFHDVVSSDMGGQNLVSEATALLNDLDVVGHAVSKSGAEAILDVAGEVGADLIVVGSRGHGAGRRLLLGSVSAKVSHHADCAVLIVQDPENSKS